jgi:predicted TIM-barrel fold metal-dependent hydrolase
VTELLRRHPRLTAVIAHAGAPEYAEFLELAERFERVHLDTTMVRPGCGTCAGTTPRRFSGSTPRLESVSSAEDACRICDVT